MRDLATDLRDYFDALVEPVDEVAELPPVVVGSESRRRWRTAVIAAASIAVLGIGVVGLRSALDGENADVTVVADDVSSSTTPPDTPTTVLPFDGALGGGWHDIDTGPVPAVESPTMAWTGTDLFVGVGPTMVYALDASSGIWTQLPPLPDGMGTADGPPALIATDVGLLAVEDSFQLAGSALWDAERGEWLDLGEIEVADNLAAIGTGMRARGSWGGGPALVWTGEAVLDLYHGAVWSPTTREWSTLPGPAEVTRFTALLNTTPVWDGHEVVAAAWSTAEGLAWDASGTEYREIPGLPAELSDPTGAGRPWSDDALATVVNGRVYLLSGTEGSLVASFDSRTDTWIREPSIGVGYGGEGCPTHVAATASGPIAQPCFDDQRFALVDGAWQVLQGGPEVAGTTWLEIDGNLFVWGIVTTDGGVLEPRAGLWVASANASPSVEPVLDPIASDVCPPEAAGMRIVGGRLVAGFDTTVADVADLVGHFTGADDTPTVVCWYDDAEFIGSLAATASTTGATTIYIDGELVHAAMDDGRHDVPRSRRCCTYVARRAEVGAENDSRSEPGGP